MRKFLFFIALFISISANSQKIHRSQWGLQPRVGSSSLGIASILNKIENSVLSEIEIEEMDADEYSEFWARNSWYIPEIRWMVPIYSLSAPDGTKLSRPYWWRELLWGDYSHTYRFTAGYELSWKSLISPFGAYLDIDWEYNHLVLKKSSEGGSHISQAIVPGLGLRFRLWGGSFEKEVKPALELGGSYVYNYKYRSPSSYDKDALNNGFRGKIGVGVELPYAHTAILLEYEHEFFDHFNKDYEIDGVKPFSGYKNTFGEISLKVSSSF